MRNVIASLISALYILTGCGGSNDTNSRSEFGGSESKAVDEALEEKAGSWYIRIVVEDTANNLKTSDAQLGQLEKDDAAYTHSLKAINPFGSTYLDVVFRDPVDLASGDYKSNFHTTSTDSDSWEFTIKSHDANADMILSWRGLYVLTPYLDNEERQRYHEVRSMTNPLLDHMKLVDLSTGVEVPALHEGMLNTYAFNMDGQTEKTFRWVLQDEISVSTLSSKQQMLNDLKISALRKDAKVIREISEDSGAQSFDMTQPPKFEVLVK